MKDNACISGGLRGERTMLKLSESQWQALQEEEDRTWVQEVGAQFLEVHPDLKQSPGSGEIEQRMQSAYRYARSVGFTDGEHMAKLMGWMALAPGLLQDGLLETYLRKDGATPEQRLDDLEAVIQNRVEQGD